MQYVQRQNTTGFYYLKYSMETTLPPLKKKKMLLSVHPMNGCMQQRRAYLSDWESDCTIYQFCDLGQIILFLCVMFWGQKDARDSLQCVTVMLVKKLHGPLLQRS